MTLEQIDWLEQTVAQAIESSHIWPRMAASEAALESNYGKSKLAKEANNLFGMKAHAHTQTDEILSLPTREFLDGSWIVVSADWMRYATVAECFADRMATLITLSVRYPHYATALAAIDAHIYVTEVSKTWSTDPDRAAKVIQIYTQFSDAFQSEQTPLPPMP